MSDLIGFGSDSYPVTPLVQPEPDARNYIPNPSFEIDTDGWDGINSAAIATSTAANVVVGSQSLAVTAAGPGVNNQMGFTTSANVAFSIGAGAVGTDAPHTFSAYLSTPEADIQAQLILKYWSGGSALNSSLTTYSAVSATPTRVATSLTPSSTASHFSLVVIFYHAAGDYAGGELFYADALMLNRGDTLPDYFDGDTAEDATYTYTWSGTHHGSSSNRIFR